MYSLSVALSNCSCVSPVNVDLLIFSCPRITLAVDALFVYSLPVALSNGFCVYLVNVDLRIFVTPYRSVLSHSSKFVQPNPSVSYSISVALTYIVCLFRLRRISSQSLVSSLDEAFFQC